MFIPEVQSLHSHCCYISHYSKPQRIIGRLVVLRIANHQVLHLHSAISPYLSGGNCNISVNLHKLTEEESENQGDLLTLVKPRFPCHLQRFHFEPAVRRKRHGPAHWFSCEQAENNGEVRPALARPDIGHSHITAPHLIWLGNGELPFKVATASVITPI